MIVAAISDKGGTGRTVTSANVAYQLTRPHEDRPALDVCVVDLDLGSPTFGAVLGLAEYERGGPKGVHDILVRRHPPEKVDDLLVDVWDEWADSDDPEAPIKQAGHGDLTLLPGRRDGGDVLFSDVDDDVLDVCRRLLMQLDEEYDIVWLDLSSGRSVVMDMIAHPALGVEVLWLIHHRWTRQHLVAAQGLVYGKEGLASKVSAENLFFVRTAVNEPDTDMSERTQWMINENKKLAKDAERRKLGNPERVVAEVPVEQTLYWGERLIMDEQAKNGIASHATIAAFRRIADFVHQRLQV